MQDNKTGVDYTKFYQVYLSAMQSRVNIKTDNSQLVVHVSFLCLSGALLNLTKYVTLFKDKVNDMVHAKEESFGSVVKIDFEATKEKKETKKVYKSSIIAEVCSHFSKFGSAVNIFKQLIEKISDDEKEKIFFNMLMKKMETISAQLVAEFADEVCSTWKSLEDAFRTVQGVHEVPAMFQANSLIQSRLQTWWLIGTIISLSSLEASVLRRAKISRLLWKACVF